MQERPAAESKEETYQRSAVKRVKPSNTHQNQNLNATILTVFIVKFYHTISNPFLYVNNHANFFFTVQVFSTIS